MQKKLILVALILALASSQQWYLYEEQFDNVSLQPTDLEGWVFEGNQNNNELTYCGDITLVGGYQSAGNGAVLSKKYAEIPSHYKVKIVVTVFFIDSWDYEDFLINVNGQNVFAETSFVQWHTPMCGWSDYGERVSTLEVEVAHFESDLEVSFSSTLNEGAANESWGIRDYQLYIQRCEEGCKVVTEEFVGNDFTDADVQDWVPSRQDFGEWTQECDGNRIVGGFGKFGNKFSLSKTFSELPEHYKLIVAFKMWQIDSWDGNEAFRVVIDGKQSFSQVKKSGAWGGSYNCGSAAYGDELVDVTVEVPHFGSEVTVNIEDFLNENTQNESWGISSFRIYALKCEDKCTVVSSELVEESFNADSIVGWVDENGDDYNVAGSCTRVSVVGGYNNLAGGQISKTFTGLPEHTHLMFAVEVWFIDNWDNEDFTVTVDQVPGVTTTKTQGEWTLELGNVCGNSGADEIQLLYVEVPHSGDSATVTLISDLNQSPDDESWGFREVHVMVTNQQANNIEISRDFNDEVFTSYSDEWVVENPVSSAASGEFQAAAASSSASTTSDCGGKTLLGGYDTFSGKTHVSRTWTDLPEHDYAVFYFKAYFIDSWDKEAFLAQVDGIKRKQLSQLSVVNIASQELCGWGAATDDIVAAELRFEHTDSTLKLEIFTMLNEAATEESWGIRDFSFFVGKDAVYRPTCPTLYTECGYEGESFNLCENVDDFSSVDWTHQVRSVWIPEGWEATLYVDTNQQGEKHTFTEPVECLEDGPVYQFIRVNAPKKAIKTLSRGHLKTQNTLKIKQHLRSNKKSKL